jgi:hypothetical protein
MYCRLLISKCTPQLSWDLPMSKVFMRISFALGGILFLQLHGLADEHSVVC